MAKLRPIEGNNKYIRYNWAASFSMIISECRERSVSGGVPCFHDWLASLMDSQKAFDSLRHLKSAALSNYGQNWAERVVRHPRLWILEQRSSFDLGTLSPDNAWSNLH